MILDNFFIKVKKVMNALDDLRSNCVIYYITNVMVFIYKLNLR